MNDDQLLRYSRHLLLNEMGIEGQARLLEAHVLVIGAGGLGCAAALYLGSAGVGQITLVDDDVVDVTNLQRQIAHTLDRVGEPKVASLQQAIAAINPDVRVTARQTRADAAFLQEWVPQVDLILDCSDNFSTRHAINAASVAHRKPLVSGAAIRMDGQVTLYDPQSGNSPCYACLFSPGSPVEETQCATMGVFAPLVGLVGSIQAAEAIKWISHAGRPLTGRLLMIDGRAMQFHELHIPRRSDCPVCAKT
jgi:molybdopterin/thiamine biosynthesis adenylyltransferase